MRKLIFPLFFSLILFLISGCQTETPVSPTTQDNTLAKGRSFNFTGTVQSSGDGFVQVNLEWTGMKNVAYYTVSYYNRLMGRQITTDELPDTTTYFSATYAMLQQNNDTGTITVNAYKLRKGNPVLIASGTQNFTYIGSSLVTIPLTVGYLGDAVTDILVDQYLSFISDAYTYSYTIVPSWEDNIYSGTLTNYFPTGGEVHTFVSYTTLNSDVFVALTIYGYDDNNNLTGIATKNIYYSN